MSLIECIPNTFFINTPPPDVYNASSLCTAQFSVFTWVLCLDQSWAEQKNLCLLELSDLGVNAEFTHSHCTQKPAPGGFKWDFWPVEKGYNTHAPWLSSYNCHQLSLMKKAAQYLWHHLKPYFRAKLKESPCPVLKQCLTCVECKIVVITVFSIWA